MKSRIVLLGLLVAVLLLSLVGYENIVQTPVATAKGVGTIRINPALPVASPLSQEFTIWVQQPKGATYDPHVLLVMTEECFGGLSSVSVTWEGGGSLSLTSFASATDGTIPTSGVRKGAGYTVASLRDHLGVADPTEPIYWAMGPFLGGPLTQEPQAFTVTLSTSTKPRMLVYALGKFVEGGDFFTNRIPPTIPGFVVPEAGSLAAAGISLCTLIGFVLWKKRG